MIRDRARSRGLVLVVEDNEGMREAIDDLLNAAGFSALTYPSAESLLAGRRMQDAVCVICDVKLPAMSGFELLAELQTLSAVPPVILIAANDAPGLRRKAKRCRAAAYLARPISGSALVTAIESVAVQRGQDESMRADDDRDRPHKKMDLNEGR